MQSEKNDFSTGSFMSSLPNTNLTLIGIAAPAATIFGILLNVIYFIYYDKKLKKNNLYR